jgi:glutamyl-Q tRNA(Asp) synthetase
MARTAGGTFLLRIEDIDRARCRADYEAAILEDLQWLGITWDEPPVRQSERLHLYQDALDRLRDMGVIYRCFKTRRDLMDLSAPHETAKPYFGHALHADAEQQLMAAGTPYAWRLSLARCRTLLGDRYATLHFTDAGKPIHATPDILGDAVLARKDVGVAYHLAVVVDDATQAVSDVVRGRDLFESTHIHVVLQALLGLPTPAYHHHRLIVDENGARLAKRKGSDSLRDLRARGVGVDALRAEWAQQMSTRV